MKVFVAAALTVCSDSSEAVPHFRPEPSEGSAAEPGTGPAAERGLHVHCSGPAHLPGPTPAQEH